MTSIDRLLEELHEELERDPRGRQVARLLARFASQSDDWRRYAHFDPDGYARNLVHRDERFEVILLCWGEGQESPIHDHAGQQCWMSVVEGRIEELHYEEPRAGQRGPLTMRRRATLERGGVAYIDDGIALHKVRPEAGGSGVSLHVYSQPIETCRIYDEATGEVRARELRFYSVAGELVGG